MATPEIIVGVDFGTTYSGVSWALNAGSKSIRLISDWPDPTAQNSSRDKVPSLITYIGGKPNGWGYAIGPKDEPFRWIKILLEENHEKIGSTRPVIASRELLLKLSKTAQDVVTDYLRFLWEYTVDDIKRVHPDFSSLYTLRMVLTVPAIWSEAAKAKTLQAARSAGMPKDIALVSEPEAAALATLKGKANESSLKVGNAFVVCDAGGGTVDLISYQIQKTTPLEIRECAVGSGGLCGSIFLDQNFEKYISTIVGERQYANIKPLYRRQMMRGFEHGIKRSFTENSDQTYSVDLIGVEDDPKNDVFDDSITINKTTLRSVFDSVYLQIEQLISDQIQEVEEKGIDVKAIILVGGFGANRYLHGRLDMAHEQDGLQVLQVHDAWSSICRGATMWGLEHHSDLNLDGPSIVSKMSRFSYGVNLCSVYDPSRHLLEDRFLDEVDGIYKAGNQMNWVLKRGEHIQEGSKRDIPIVFSLPRHGPRSNSRTTSLYYNNSKIPPLRRTSAVEPLVEIHYVLDYDQVIPHGVQKKNALNRDRYLQVSVTLRLILGNTKMEFMVLVGEKPVGQVEVSYVEASD